MLGPLKRILRRSRILLFLVRFMRRRIIWPVRRRRAAKAYFRSHEQAKLNIGAGPDFRLEGWLNTDRNPHHSRGVAYLDATEPFPFKDSTFDYVTSEHLIEHLTYEEGLGMLGECFRVLKPGGRLRIATPDLQVYVDLFGADKSDVQQRYIRYHVDKFLPSFMTAMLEGPPVSHRSAERARSVCERCGPNGGGSSRAAVLTCFVINNEFRDWGHRFIYDRETLSAAMEQAGFVDVVRHASGESDDENLRGIELHGKVVGNEEMNRFETMALEARRPS
jgi:SAM-dependent methyltransferase